MITYIVFIAIIAFIAYVYCNRSNRSNINGTLVVVDLETTGLNPNKNSILEVAAQRVHFENGVMTFGDSFSTIVLLDEGKRVSSKIQQITGIDTKMMREQGIPRAEAIAKLVQFVGDDDIVGYNVKFDMGFLKAQTNAFDKKETLCMLAAARKNLKGLPSYKLVNVAQHLRIDNSGAHRAMADVMMTAKVLDKLAK